MDGQASLKTQSGGRRTENREQMTEDRGQSEKLKAEGRPAVTHSLLCARGPGRITVFRWPGASVVVTLFINQTTSPKHRPPPSPIFRLPSSVLHLPSPGTQGPGTNTQNEWAGKPAPYKQRPCGAFSVARSAIKRSLSLRDKHHISLRDKGLDRFQGYSWESNPSGIGHLCPPPALAPTCGQKCPRSILRWYLCSKNLRCAQWHPVATKYFDKLFPAINLPLMLAPPYSQLANDELCRAEAPQT